MIDRRRSQACSATLEVTNEAALARDESVCGSHQVSATGLLSCLLSRSTSSANAGLTDAVTLKHSAYL
jgi:hypothetical protein